MGLRVLVVDDSLFMRVHTTNVLKNISEVEQVIYAENGKEALEVYKEKRPDLVTMDIDMPIMNGIDAVQKICLFDFKAKVVMITAANQQSLVDSTKKLGAISYITKPFDREDIIQIVRNISKKITV